MSPLVNAKDIEIAAQVLAGVANITPLQPSHRLTEEVGRPVFLKREDQQKCRSFKLRGAYVRMAAMDETEKRQGVVCASAGNHAQGVAWACAHLGIKGRIYLPSSTPKQKRQRIASIGKQWVEQVIIPGDFDEANLIAIEAARETASVYVHPYDDPYTIAGQGTIAVELSKQIPKDTDMILIPVGGGGLIAGMAVWLKNNYPKIRIIGVESEGAASMHAALKADKPVALDKVDAFVDGTAVGQAGTLTYDIVRNLVDDLVTVPEGAICTEMLDLYHCEGIIAEPAGALATTAARNFLPQIPNGSVVCLISGGNNDLSRYAEVVERSGRYEGLRHYFLVTFSQQPGALRSFLNDVLCDGEDIIHFQYTKKNNRETGPALVGIELQNPTDIRGLRKRMAASPLQVQEIDPQSDYFKMLI